MQKTTSDPGDDEIRKIISAFATLEGPLLQMLHALQHAYDHIPANAISVLAEVLNIGKAEIHGTITFYSDFRYKRPGRRVLKICRSEACQARGGRPLADAALRKLGVEWGGTTSDGKVTVEPVYCLGLCACGPAAMLGDDLVARLDEEGMDRLLAEARS